MNTTVYTSRLKQQLELLARTSEELTRVDEGKSQEQFLAELDVVAELLAEAREITEK